ncbi:MAG: hypothetical protein RLN90_08485 [Balneolaceae bacterium]
MPARGSASTNKVPVTMNWRSLNRGFRSRATEPDKVTNGNNPQTVKDKLKATPVRVLSFSDLCERFIKRLFPTLRKKTSIEYERVINKELIPVLDKRPAESITRKEIIDLLDSIAIDRCALTLSNRVLATFKYL